MCGFAEIVEKDADIKTVQDWQIDVPMTELAVASGYQLEDEQVSPINEKSVAALLTRIANTRADKDIQISLFGYVGGFVCAVIFGSLFWSLRHLGFFLFGRADEFAHAFAGVISGGLLGSIVTTVYELLRHNNVKRKLELQMYMQNLGLTADDIRSFAAKIQPADHRINALVNSIP